MSEAQRNYSGWLQVIVGPTEREQLESLARNVGLALDIADGYIEFEYQGRDSNRFVVRFLVGVAKIIGDADGEIRCDTEPEEGDPVFEFYRIKGRKLIRQRGEIMRGPPETVTGG